MSEEFKLVLIRGLPGSGKSTLARQMVSEDSIFEADHFFLRNGVYKFEPTLLPVAHAECLLWAHECIRNTIRTPRESWELLGSKPEPVVVANCFLKAEHMAAYIEVARHYNIKYEIHSLFDAGLSDEELAARNVHNVPKHTISRMRYIYEEYVDW